MCPVLFEALRVQRSTRHTSFYGDYILKNKCKYASKEIRNVTVKKKQVEKEERRRRHLRRGDTQIREQNGMECRAHEHLERVIQRRGPAAGTSSATLKRQ